MQVAGVRLDSCMLWPRDWLIVSVLVSLQREHLYWAVPEVRQVAGVRLVSLQEWPRASTQTALERDSEPREK